MKTLNIISLVCSLFCLLNSIIEKDFTESLAWIIVSINSIKELFLK